MSICRHENILKCFGCCGPELGPQVILLDHAPNGDLESFYGKIKKLEDNLDFERQNSP